MNKAETISPIAIAKSRCRTIIVVAYYVLTIAMSAFVLLFHGQNAVLLDTVGGTIYFAVTALLYDLCRRSPS